MTSSTIDNFKNFFDTDEEEPPSFEDDDLLNQSGSIRERTVNLLNSTTNSMCNIGAYPFHSRGRLACSTL